MQKKNNLILYFLFSFNLLGNSQHITDLNDPRIPSVVRDSIGITSIGSNDPEPSIFGSMVYFDSTFDKLETYAWNLRLNKKGELIGVIEKTIIDSLRGTNAPVTIKTKYQVATPILFYCTTNKLWVVKWSERKKYPRCEYWKLVTKKKT